MFSGRASTNGVEGYNLPDGRVIELGKELTHCAEPLFNPGLVGKSSLGLTQLVKQTLERWVIPRCTGWVLKCLYVIKNVLFCHHILKLVKNCLVISFIVG